MKKALLITAALALVLGLSQCRKPNVPAINGSGNVITQHVTVGASYNGVCNSDGSKVAGEDLGGGNFKLTWEEGDQLWVYDEVMEEYQPTNLTIVSGQGTTKATFEGTITITPGNEITFYYMSSCLVNMGAKPYQVGELLYYQNGSISTSDVDSYKFSLKDVMYLESETVTCTGEPVAEYSCDMKPYPILKLDLSALGSEGGNDVTIVWTEVLKEY